MAEARFKICEGVTTNAITSYHEKVTATTDKLREVQEQLVTETNHIKAQTYTTTEQVERLAQHQIEILESVIQGTRLCTQLFEKMDTAINKKIKRTTRFAAIFALVSIAALVIAIVR
jgi:hypothetical protein